MLDIPGHELLDKDTLIGGCLRLPLAVDAGQLGREVAALPGQLWGSRGGRVGVHRAAEAIFLRGFAPAEGDLPVEDRPVLQSLPYAHRLIHEIIPATPLRCLLARLPAGAVVAPHVDLPPYFGKSLRLHVAVETNEDVHMLSAGLCYHMRPGEIWVLNNSTQHAVWNAHATRSRTHLICDFLPSAALLELMRRGERHLGERRPEVDRRVTSNIAAAVDG